MDVLIAFLTLCLLSLPLALSVWALLDAANRPAWTWALTGRSRVNWIAAIAFGVLILIAGIAISATYLVRVRRQLAAVEAGDFNSI